MGFCSKIKFKAPNRKHFVKTTRFEIPSHRSFQISTSSCKCLKETPCTPSLVNIRASERVRDVLPASSQRSLKEIISKRLWDCEWIIMESITNARKKNCEVFFFVFKNYASLDWKNRESTKGESFGFLNFHGQEMDLKP